MANFDEILKELRKKMDLASEELERWTKAVVAMEPLTRMWAEAKPKIARRRKMSLAARRKIAAAQRARWAKLKAEARQHKKAA